MKPTVIALGFFDGVHRGHGALLRRTVEVARQLNATPAAFTFDRPPKEVVTGKPVPLINSAQERQGLMERLYGIQQVIIAPFDHEMMTMPWQDFITELLVKRYGAVHLVAGHDYHFGHKNAGDPVLLQQKCRCRRYWKCCRPRPSARRRGKRAAISCPPQSGRRYCGF